MGADVDFVKPVILDFRNDLWKLQPQGRVSGPGTEYVAFEQDRPAAPAPVGGNVRIATFNMLNYFVHPAQDWVANSTTPGLATPGSNRTCTYYTARSTPSPAERLTADTCTWTDPRTSPPTLLATGPRGAATAASLARQEAKEVAAINTMDADVMSLEEVENPVKIGYADRDAALKRLVDALNADWDAAHPRRTRPRSAPAGPTSRRPRPEAQPTIAEQDAIRAAFIYNPRVVADRRLVRDPGQLRSLPQRPRAARPGLQADGCEPRRRVHRDRQPLQVQGKQHRDGRQRRPRRRRGCLQRRPSSAGRGPGRVRQASSPTRSRSRRSS